MTRTSKNTFKKDILSLISHEMRTPLSSILNAVRLLREDNTLSSAQRDAFLEMAERNAERLNAVLLELLDLSKITSGKLVCRFQEVPLGVLVRNQVALLRSSAAKANKKIKLLGLAKGPDALATVVGDPARLDQVLASVFDNAVKFGNEIEVEIAQSNTSVCIVVSNAVANGSIDKNHDVFKLFSQPEKVLSRSKEGLGGSLAIAAEVVMQHGGEISAELRDKRFSLKLVLPILRDEEALVKVLESRLFGLKNQIGALSLLVVRPSKKSNLEALFEAFRAAVFRASDSVYLLPKHGEVVVLLEDCKKKDAPKLVDRLLSELKLSPKSDLAQFKTGLANAPEDAINPEQLLSAARKELS